MFSESSLQDLIKKLMFVEISVDKISMGLKSLLTKFKLPPHKDEIKRSFLVTSPSVEKQLSLQETLEPTSCSTTLATSIHDRNCPISELMTVLPPSNNCYLLHFFFIIPRTVLLPSIQPETETLDLPTHELPRNLIKSSYHVNTNKGNVVKQSSNDVKGCQSQKFCFNPICAYFCKTV